MIRRNTNCVPQVHVCLICTSIQNNLIYKIKRDKFLAALKIHLRHDGTDKKANKRKLLIYIHSSKTAALRKDIKWLEFLIFVHFITNNQQRKS